MCEKGAQVTCMWMVSSSSSLTITLANFIVSADFIQNHLMIRCFNVSDSRYSYQLELDSVIVSQKIDIYPPPHMCFNIVAVNSRTKHVLISVLDTE